MNKSPQSFVGPAPSTGSSVLAKVDTLPEDCSMKLARKSRRSTLTALILLAGIASIVSVFALEGRSLPRAEAQALRASAYVTQAAIPRGLTEKALIGFARGHNARALEESTEAEIPSRRWLANLVVAFNAPPGDLEYHALFYDVTSGAREFVADMSVFLTRGQKTYVQRLTLPRPRFAPNKHYEAVITVRRQEVATLRFDTRGQEIQRSGMVDFTQPGMDGN
jgi:hypothetical protein